MWKVVKGVCEVGGVWQVFCNVGQPVCQLILFPEDVPELHRYREGTHTLLYLSNSVVKFF